MSGWKYSNVSICFSVRENDEKLVKQAMKCLGFTETEYLYLDETGVDGPDFGFHDDICSFDYKLSARVKVPELLALLNQLFKKVSVYSVSALGNSVSDYYSGEENTYNLFDNKHTKRKFDYCYGEGTAFGRYVDSDDLSEKGSRISKKAIDKSILKNYTADMLKKLIAGAEKHKYTELLELAKQVPMPADEKENAKADIGSLPESISGLKFVVTGDLKKFASRSELEAFIESRGGKLVGSVSSKTNYLITNFPNSGTTKVQKAQELGVQIISEAQFLKMAK